MTENDLVFRIKELLFKKNMKISDLEKLVKIKPNGLKNWNSHVLTIEKIYEIANILDVSVECLLNTRKKNVREYINSIYGNSVSGLMN